MGFLITSEVQLPNGLSASGIQVSVGGSYTLSKMIHAMTQEPIEPAKYCVGFTYTMYKVQAQPITRQQDGFLIEQVAGLDLFAEIYSRLKAKFPDATTVDN